MTSHLSLLFRTYAALNAGDAEAALATMTEDVEWPDLWSDEGVLVGHDALRRSWGRHWARLTPHFRMQGYLRLPDGRLRLDLSHTDRAPGGDLLASRRSRHVYGFRDELIARMEAA